MHNQSWWTLSAVAAAMFSVGVSLTSVACGGRSSGSDTAPTVASAAPSTAPSVRADAVAVAGAAPSSVASAVASAVATPSTVTTASAAVESGKLSLKRLVVTNGIDAREPKKAAELVSDGQPIFAFAELVNGGPAQQIQITFERKGSDDRVGHVKLAVPAETARYRTWGQTRLIRTPGEWEAVVRAESGEELGRAPFAVL